MCQNRVERFRKQNVSTLSNGLTNIGVVEQELVIIYLIRISVHTPDKAHIYIYIYIIAFRAQCMNI